MIPVASPAFPACGWLQRPGVFERSNTIWHGPGNFAMSRLTRNGLAEALQ